MWPVGGEGLTPKGLCKRMGIAQGGAESWENRVQFGVWRK